MRAVAAVRARRAGEGRTVFEELRSSPLLTLRRAVDGLYLVAGAATPLGGDDAQLSVELGPGSTVVVRSAAAAVARRGRRGEASQLRIDVTIGTGACLVWAVEPTVAAAGCRAVTDVTMSLAAGARCWWRDQVVLGRAGEPPGSWTSSLRVDRDGHPVLRQRLALGAGAAGADGPAVVGGDRVVGTVALLGVGPSSGDGDDARSPWTDGAPSETGAVSGSPAGDGIDPAGVGRHVTVLPLASGQDFVVTAAAATHPELTCLLASGTETVLGHRSGYPPHALVSPVRTTRGPDHRPLTAALTA